MGSNTVQGTSDPPPLGQTEGCYNKVDYQLSVIYDKVELDNTVCQKYCASQRFAISATSQTTCYCGNLYPGPEFRVDDIFCNNPCSADREICIAYACCGSKDGAYFTVAFADELDPTLELLRQLTYDYRNRNPTINRYMDKLMGTSAPLQVLAANTNPMNTMASNSAPVLMSSGGSIQTSGGLAFSGSCPDYYREFEGRCYRRIAGTALTYMAAVAKCQKDHANLAIIRSSGANAYIQQRLNGQAGWFGLSNHPDGNWRWTTFMNWDTNQPSEVGTMVKTNPYGVAAGGTAFDDMTPSIRVGMGLVVCIDEG